MVTWAVQYLEPGPHVSTVDPAAARAKLRAACEILPFSDVIVGWDLPASLVAVCREEADRVGARLIRWQPLLTSDGTLAPRREWRTLGPRGEPVPGFRDMPEFTFVCPNRPAVREAALARLDEVIRQGPYDGVFLDRIRFPSPALDPTRWLACFCDDCRRAAGDGLDLDELRDQIDRRPTTPVYLVAIVKRLLGSGGDTDESGLRLLDAFLDFRARTIARIVGDAADLVRAAGLEVGVDCFSPALARLVGQDLAALDAVADWTKLMTYGQTFAPAGLPFELHGLADWLVTRGAAGDGEAKSALARATGLPMPSTLAGLRNDGLSVDALAVEVRNGRTAGVRRLYAGLELVEIPGVVRREPERVVADVRAFLDAGVDGFVLSWDLWQMPLERLELVANVFAESP